MPKSMAKWTVAAALSIASGQTPEPPPRLTPDQLASQIRGRDLSLDPIAVEDSSFALLSPPVQGANALVRVRFSRLETDIPRKLAIALERVEQQTWLRDDGVYPDRTAYDGIYHALAPFDTAQIVARRIKAERAGLVRNGSARVSPFDGRQKLPPREFLVPGPLELTLGRQIPFGGFGFGALIPQRSLVATHTSVINDPVRTFKPCPVPTGNPNGVWTFKYLMQQMANTPVTGVTAEQLTRAWVDTFGVGQPGVNGQAVAPRPRLKQFILDPWIAASGGPLAPLNLDLAPFELTAIFNRLDLRGNSVYGGRGGNGELRFIFQVLEPGTCKSEGFTVIFEFGLPASGCQAAKSWAQQWADLPVLPSAAYNTALEAITAQVVVAGTAPAKPAGSALNQLRTNERYEGMAPEDDDWQMREYKLRTGGPAGLRLEAAVVARTPAGNYNTSDKLLLRDFINGNEFNILLQRHNIPLAYPGQPAKPFRGAASANFVGFFWDPTGVFNGNARHKFAVNTCNGCHTHDETKTGFLHVRSGSPVILSGFLTGVSVTDPVDGTPREFNDLERRAADMEELLNSSCLAKGIGFTQKFPH